ncbi:MAG: substrate-binding domain-containing protein [Solirubrobacteraceae bacterium]|nr:substrate-binding domain-containing protein [Solirubrobacteraceae bacterium]
MISRTKLASALAVSVVTLIGVGSETAAAADCSGSSRILGRGASFANLAHNDLTNGWIVNAGCQVGSKDATFAGGDDLVFYEGLGSGAGLTAFGGGNATPGVRDQTVAFVGTDDAPSPAQLANMNEGSNPSSVNPDGDDGKLHQIPVAQGATAFIVNAPTTCKAGASGNAQGRPKLPVGVAGDTNQIVEKVFSGEATTWGALGLVNKVGGAPCSVAIKRVVRQDNSGTTFQFKKFLESTDQGATTAWSSIDEVSENNTIWPDPSAPNPVAPGAAKDSDGTCDGIVSGTPLTGNWVCTATASGNGNLSTLVANTPGAVGYSDLATARSRGFDLNGSASTDATWWFPLYSPSSTSIVFDPTSQSNGYKTGITTAQKGARCANAKYGINGGTALPANLTVDWSTTVQQQTGSVYPACVVTFMAAWEDYEDVYPTVNCADLKARQADVADYIQYILGIAPIGTGANEGQTLLPTADYSPLSVPLRNKANLYLAQAAFDETPDRNPIRTC